MAHQQYNNTHPYPPQNGQQPPPVQTQNLNQYHAQRPFSPPAYQQSPTALSPTLGSGIPPAKRQRLSPNPTSPAPYQSPFAMSPYPQSQPQSPYAASPQYNAGHLSVPGSPAAQHPPPFHQPQPYHHPGAAHHQSAHQSSMPPPKVPYSKAQDNSELEKANARDLDVNNLSDVLSGGFIDLRAEEEMLQSNYSSRDVRASFNSQLSGSTATPTGSFSGWTQQSGHGAFQGSGPLSETLTEEQQQAELLRKHEHAARILNESSQQPLTDPFAAANVLRHRIAKRAYEVGISVNVDGLFDKIPEKTPRDVERKTRDGANGEQIIGLEAASLLNQNAPLVDILSLLSLAAEERIRTILEDSFALSRGRVHTAHGVVPPQFADIAVVDKDAERKMVPPVNILRTPWESADGVVSPVTASKQAPNPARLPTPPSEAPPTPRSTYQNVNPIADFLRRQVAEDEKWEQRRINKRNKRLQGNSATPVETPTVALPPPDRMTKKDKDALKKQNQTDEVIHRKANETANMALGFGKKKKYSWMTGGGGPSSGASTPRATPAQSGSGTTTPAGPSTEKGLVGKRRKYGHDIENTEIGAKIQMRDLITVLDHDGRDKKALAAMMVRLKNTEKDEKRPEFDRRMPSVSGR